MKSWFRNSDFSLPTSSFIVIFRRILCGENNIFSPHNNSLKSKKRLSKSKIAAICLVLIFKQIFFA